MTNQERPSGTNPRQTLPLKGYQGDELYAMSWICTMCELLEGYEGFSLDNVEFGIDQEIEQLQRIALNNLNPLWLLNWKNEEILDYLK